MQANWKRGEKYIVIGSTEYWFITCNEDGWKGAPIGWQDSSSLLVIANDEEFLTISCVEYCEAHGGEGVNITSALTIKDVNYKYRGEFSLKENFKQVECDDQTHSLFNNGEQVNSSRVECDARGWSSSALQKLPFDIAKRQQFECRNAEVSTTTTSVMQDTTPNRNDHTAPTDVPTTTTSVMKDTKPNRNDPTAPTEAPTPSATRTTEGPVAAAQSSLVIICSSLGGILLLAIIIVAVICVLRSSKSREPENVDNEMDTEIDVQMEDRRGSEHPEAESDFSEI
ncbi:hypothetical protein PRIPAC_71092 [Pristionchus pacificus]|uniref:Uncharacterized protein n=1 Tax=Pristionchus pacificus TaxID=54126 RepID=A0A8R1UQW0_PRIPA|nr:hypothetical protein PRIPAC_71092 [Pristionchus pacificus]